jgi:hypothetical protein
VQRTRSLVIIDVVVRDRTGGIQAEITFTEGKPELHDHEGVVEAHGGCCVRVGGDIQNGEGCGLHCGLELVYQHVDECVITWRVYYSRRRT